MKAFYFLIAALLLTVNFSVHGGDLNALPPRALVLTDCEDYSTAIAARDFIVSRGGKIAIIGSKNAMIGWIDPSIVDDIIGHHGVTAIHYKQVDVATLTRSDRQTFQTISFFNSLITSPVEHYLSGAVDKPLLELECQGALPHPKVSYVDYVSNLEGKQIDISKLESKNQLLKFKSDGSLLTGNSDVMVGTVAVGLFFVESNGASDPNLLTWTRKDEATVYQTVMRDLSFWSVTALKYGKSVSFLLLPRYGNDPVCQQPFEPVLYSWVDVYSRHQDSLWIGAIMNNLGFRSGYYTDRVTAFNTWLRANHNTDWAFSAFFMLANMYNSQGWGFGGYAYLGGPYTHITYLENFFSDPQFTGRMLFAHETGHIFWAPDEYGGCTHTDNTKSGIPNGNCYSNQNTVLCIMYYSASWKLCAFTPGHVGWTKKATQYTVTTNPPGLFVGISGFFASGTNDRQYISPRTFPWGLGWTPEVFIVSPQVWNGRKYEFVGWSDGGQQIHEIVTSTDTLYTAYFSDAGNAVPNWLVFQEVNSGLPSNFVRDIAIDPQHIVWIGSGGSLARFHGTSWQVYNVSNYGITSIAIDAKGQKWVGTYGGLVRFDGTNWTFYNTTNSPLPNNSIAAISVDTQDNVWIGTAYGGLARFDGVNWQVYNVSNSGMPSNYVRALAIDAKGRKWVGTDDGLAKFDGENWSIYRSNNSGLPYNVVDAITVDGKDNLWIATSGGSVSKFDGVNWQTYKNQSSNVLDIAIDNKGQIWFGTEYGGLARFDGLNWTAYHVRNSLLPLNEVSALALSPAGNIWIGTFGGGLAVFNESGITVSVIQDFQTIPSMFKLLQNYPNPFNPATTISYGLPTRSVVRLAIYNVLGQVVSELVNGEQDAGYYDVQWTPNAPSGIYFYRVEAVEASNPSKRFVDVKKMVILR